MITNGQHKTRMLWLVGLLHGLTHVYHVVLLPLYLLIQRDLGFASVGQASSLMTVLMVAYFLPSYALGVAADRLNRRKLLAWGLAVNGLGFVGLALAPNYACAVAAVIVAGLGGSGYHPAATALVAWLFPVNTGRALGLAAIGASAGFFVAPLYSGWRAASLEAARGAAAWRAPVLELGLLGILVAGVFAMLARDEPGETASAGLPRAPADPLFPSAALWVWFLAGALAFSLRDFAGSSMSSLSSLFLQKAHGYDAGRVGWTLSCLFLAGMVGSPLLGSLSDRGPKRWTALVLTVAAGLIAVFPHVPGRWTLAALVGFGFFFNANYPMVEAALMQSVPDAVRGRVFGLFMTLGGFMGNLSHWVMGEQVRRMGDAAQHVATYRPLYAVLAGLMVASLSGLWCLHALRRREHLPEPSGTAAAAGLSALR